MVGRFTHEQILDMRTRYRDGELQKTIAIRYKVTQHMLSLIVTGHCYPNVPWPIPLPSRLDRRSLTKFPDYEFDAEGNAYSFKNNKLHGRKMRLWPDGNKGYLKVSLSSIDGKPCLVRVNRIICTLFRGHPPSSKSQARHLNGIKTDNRAVNLAWGTQKENEADKMRYGAKTFGEKNGNSKLTETIIRKIRVSRLSTRKLAEKYNVSQPLIVRIKQRKAWKHVLQYSRS